MSKFALCLSGFGDITGIERVPRGMMIKIKVLSKSSDDIELECLVDQPDLIDRLDTLSQSCYDKEYVVIHFIAHYSQLSYCYTGWTKQDPDQMVRLKGKLMEFKGWVRDGELPAPSSPKDI